MDRTTFTCSIPLTLSSGVEVNINLVLDNKPARQEQKIKTLVNYVQQYPSGWKKRLELADLLYVMGNWQQAIKEYRQVIKRQPHRIDLQLKLGKILQLSGRETEAITIYEDALLLIENQAAQHHIQGLTEICKGDTPGAIKAFTSATSLEPDNAAHWLALGQVQMEAGNAGAAWQAFEAILSLNRDDLVALLYSYDALITVGNITAAQERLNRGRALAPDDYQVLKRLADCRCRLKLVSGEEGKQTKQMLHSVIRLAPHAADVHRLFAYYHILRAEEEKGIRVLQQFTEQHPNNPSGWYYYGQCLSEIGKAHEAAEVMVKAYHLYPKYREIDRVKKII